MSNDRDIKPDNLPAPTAPAAPPSGRDPVVLLPISYQPDPAVWDRVAALGAPAAPPAEAPLRDAAVVLRDQPRLPPEERARIAEQARVLVAAPPVEGLDAVVAEMRAATGLGTPLCADYLDRARRIGVDQGMRVTDATYAEVSAGISSMARERDALRAELARVTGERDAALTEAKDLLAVVHDQDTALDELTAERDKEKARADHGYKRLCDSHDREVAEKEAHAATRAREDDLMRLAGAVVEALPGCTYLACQIPATHRCPMDYDGVSWTCDEHVTVHPDEQEPVDWAAPAAALRAHLASGGRS